MLEEAETAFDFVPFLVQFLVIFTLDFSVSLRWNDGYRAARFHIIHNGIRIVTLISKQRLKLQPFNQRNRLSAIGFLSGRQHESERIAECVAHAMNLRREPAAGTA